MANTVSWTIAGDASSLTRAFDQAGSSAVKMAGDFDKAEGKSKSFSGAMDRAGDAADGSESKFMGAADLLDGLGGAFGLPTEGATGLMRAFGDLSGGFATIGPMIGTVGTMFKGMATTLMTPPAGIILLIGALAAALVVAYQKSETFRNIVQGAFNVVKGAAEGLWNFIRGFPDMIAGIGGRIVDVITWPYRTAFNLVSDAWNATIGRVGFKAPDWVPLVGGKGWNFPTMPRFHTGGIVPGPPGAEVPILAMAGETVIPAGRGGRSYQITVQALDPRAAAELVVRAIDAYESVNGPRYART